MNCQEFWDSNPEIAADADLRHAAECERCAALLNRHHRLADGLKTAAAERRQTEAPARTELALVAAFRAQNRRTGRPETTGWWGPALTWAAAASILIMAALFLLHPHQPMPSHRAAPGVVEMASLMDPADGSTADDSNFITLPNTSRLDPNEDVNVVRVEVPRSAMLAVGLAVSPDRVSEMVEADVMYSQDGVAHAIRFLDESM